MANRSIFNWPAIFFYFLIGAAVLIVFFFIVLVAVLFISGQEIDFIDIVINGSEVNNALDTVGE